MENGDQVSGGDDALAAAIGHIKALEYAVRVLIASNPQPELFHASWQALLSEIAATHASLPSNEIALFRTGLQCGLAVVSETTRLAVEGPRKEQPR